MRKGQAGKCPHCGTAVRFESTVLINAANGNMGTVDPVTVATPSNWRLRLSTSGCPACGKPILTIDYQQPPSGGPQFPDMLLWPDTGERPVPPEVTAEAPALSADFREASVVLAKSKKASAALSRRCLQFILTHKGGAKKRDLADQIDEVLPHLPTELAANVDAIRHIGNFAAHPMKSSASGAIIEVEDGEPEWLLDVLEQLFDHYYVAPAKASARRAALNAKLTAAGKPPLKTPPGSASPPTGPQSSSQ